jgi:hypothetical protein
MSVPVFISYHGKDLNLASELKTSLEKLSDRFEIFLDRGSIRAADDYEQTIADAIKRAEWFLIICTGFPRRDADMMWSFFEAGQFRATLKPSLVPHANRRIVCLFDTEPPSILSKFQGVRVCGEQPTDPKSELLTHLGKDNLQLEQAAIFMLLEQMLENSPEEPLREITSQNTRLMLREESHKLITLFEEAGSTNVVFERSLQPRISFELPRGGTIAADTPVKGYDQSLRNLFSIETEETTWKRVVEGCCKPDKGKPGWLSDIELAAASIMADNTPIHVSNKCVLGDAVYRVYAARYEIYKNGHRAIYVVFLPANSRPFDLTQRSSILLSSLILSVRFREQIIPMAKSLREVAVEELGAKLKEFYRLLVDIEIEAREFGLVIENSIPEDDSPLTAVFGDAKKKKFIMDAINDWAVDREQIEKMFVDKPVNLDSSDVAKGSADRIAGFLEKISGKNATFIEFIAEELLIRIKEGTRSSKSFPRPKRPRSPPTARSKSKTSKTSKTSRKRRAG